MLTSEIYLQDCIEGMAARLAEGSVDLCVSSIPFSDLFIYSGKPEDVGNNADGADSRCSMFGLNLRFFIAELLRVMKPGRNACIHIQQLVAYGNKHGYIGRRDFNGAVRDMFMAGGFHFYGEFVIPKNPQIVAKRSNLHSLMFATGKRDSTQLAPACNDYVLIFKKPGENRVPVRALYDREENPEGWVTTDEWIKWARGVWDDIRETDVLEGYGQQGKGLSASREEGDEKHVCPLQLEVIRRCVRLYSNAGELVLDPFVGIGSTACVSLEQGRSAVGFELKDSYHRQAAANAGKYLHRPAERQLSIFDVPDVVDTTSGTEEAADALATVETPAAESVTDGSDYLPRGLYKGAAVRFWDSGEKPGVGKWRKAVLAMCYPGHSNGGERSFVELRYGKSIHATGARNVELLNATPEHQCPTWRLLEAEKAAREVAP